MAAPRPSVWRLFAAVIVLIVCWQSVDRAQGDIDQFDPTVAVARAWTVLTNALESGTPMESGSALHALAASRTSRVLTPAPTSCSAQRKPPTLGLGRLCRLVTRWLP